MISILTRARADTARNTNPELCQTHESGTSGDVGALKIK